MLCAPTPARTPLPSAQYTKEEVEALRIDVHFPHDKLKDKVALGAITVIRRSFDFLSGYTHVPGAMTEDKVRGVGARGGARVARVGSEAHHTGARTRACGWDPCSQKGVATLSSPSRAHLSRAPY